MKQIRGFAKDGWWAGDGQGICPPAQFSLSFSLPFAPRKRTAVARLLEPTLPCWRHPTHPSLGGATIPGWRHTDI